MESTPPKESLITFGKNPSYDSSAELQLLINHLAPIKTRLETQIQNVQSLEASNQSDSQKDELIIFKASLELLLNHINFTLDVLQADSKQDVESLKGKLGPIAQQYDQLTIKQDLNPVMLEYLLVYVKEDLLVKNGILLENLAKLKDNSESTPKQTEEIQHNMHWIHIMTFRLGLINEAYARSATYSKSDIFSFPKTSQVWQDFQKHIITRRISTKEGIDKEILAIFAGVKAFYAVLRTRAHRKDSSKFPGTFSFVKESIQYHKNPIKGETLALLYFAEPNLETFRVLQLTDDPWLGKLINLQSRYVGYENYMYVPRLFPAITRDIIIQETANNTLNSVIPMEIQQGEPAGNEDKDVFQSIFTKTPESIGVRILAPTPLNIQNNFGEKLGGFYHKMRKIVTKKTEGKEIDLDAIVIHFHGGGFVSGSSAGHKIILTRWVNNLRMVHFSVDYRLAPANKYPEQLDDVWQAYLWIVNNASKLLGAQPKKVILTGDSAGGTLALTLTLRLIHAGLKPPDACLLIYPSVSRIKDICSPGHLVSLDDPVISFHVHRLFTEAYIPDDLERVDDPFIRPLLAGDELLERLPPIRVIGGTRDILFDNCVRFVYKLRRLNKDAKMIVYEDFPHGFYNMPDFKSYNQINDETCDVIRELIQL